MKISIRNIASLLIIFIPVLPEYFRLAGQPVYQYMAILLLVLIVNKRRISKEDRQMILKMIFPTTVLYFLPRILHGDIMPVISSAIVPISLLLSVFLYLKNEEDIRYILNAFIKVGICMCLFALVEYVFHYNVFSIMETVDLGAIGTNVSFRDGSVRVECSFGTAIACGIYMCAINILCLFRITEDEKNKTWYWNGYFLSAIVLYLTQSRMPLLTFILVNAIYAVRFKRTTKVFILTLLSLVFVLDCLTSRVIFDLIMEYADLIKAILTKNTSVLDASSAFRTMLGEALAPIIFQHPLAGHGQLFMDNFTFKVWGYHFISVDNNYLGILLQYGIIGLAAQMFPFIYSMILMIRMKLKGVCFPIFLTFLAYFINLMSVSQMSESRFMYMLVPIVLCKYLNVVNRE